MSTRISDVINVTAELCDETHRSNGGVYYSPAALDGFVGALSDLLKDYPETVKAVLLDMRTSFKGKLTPMDVRVRVTERISAEANQRSIDAMKAAQKIGNPSGRTYKNRSGIDRPVEELPEMLRVMYMSYCARMNMHGAVPDNYEIWLQSELQCNLLKAVNDNPDIIPEGWKPGLKW